MSQVVYLYGFVPPDTPLPPPDVAGVAGAPVRLVDLGVVRAAVADLPASVYAAPLVESRLQDLAWVGEQGMAHERVVVWFSDHSDILPARLLSLYSGDDALRTALAGRIDAIAATLRTLSGRREWNLKVAYDADELARHGAEISADLRQMEERIAAATPGRRYLLERQRADMVKQEVSRAGRSLARELLDALREHAADVRELPLTDSDENGTVVLNAALLVERSAEQALRARAADRYSHYTGLGLIISFSGPWAPYRFVEVHGDA